ncbi:MAG: cysteine desulfurase family protein [Thermodesulfobacteriota bacterium]
MKHKEIYFDNNATTKPLAEVREEVLKVMDSEFGNPSSAHSSGKRARKHLALARKQLSELIGAPTSKITFTGSGTESNNMAFYSCTRDKTNGCEILTTTVEHSSIHKMCNFLKLHDVTIKKLEVNGGGLIDTDELKKSVNENTKLVSIQWVNNETGIIQPIPEIAQICSELEVPLHTDAAQAVGKIEMNINEIPVDFFSLTGHKFHSPQGVGAIYTKDKYMLAPILFGGFQEEGFHPGTENLPGIVGMGKAAEIRKENLSEQIYRMEDLRNRFEAMVLDFVPGTKVNGDTKHRVCNTTNIMFAGIDARKLVKELDKNGVRCSQSSACTNFETAPSYVLCAMGLTEQEAYSSIRFSFSTENTYEEIDSAVNIIRECADSLKN